jgi:CelD/BcsL family acetyltransferase involved in cellulose biosynthesis
MLSLEIQGSDARAELLDPWRVLHERVGGERVATSPEWLEIWLDQYGDVVEHRFAVLRASGRVCGITLLCAGTDKKLGPFPLRTLHVGTAGERDADSACVEYNHLLVEDEYRGDLVEALADLYRAEPEWDALSLDGFSADHAGSFSAQLELDVRTYPSRYFDLARARRERRDVLELLGGSTRSNLRRQIKRLGGLEVEWASSREQAADIFAELLELHQARWQLDGEPGSFASPRFQAFVAALTERAPERVALVRVRDGARTLGCLCLLIDGTRVLDYVSGMARIEKCSPGLVTHLCAMREALARGYDAYDFLKGEHQHKVNLSTDAHELVWAEHRRPRFKYTLATAYRAGTAVIRQASKRVRGFTAAPAREVR